MHREAPVGKVSPGNSHSKPLPSRRAITVKLRRGPKLPLPHGFDKLRENFRLEVEINGLRNQVLRLEHKHISLTDQLIQKTNQYHTSPVGDLLLDQHGLIVEANRRAARILDPRSSDVTQVHFTNYLDKDQVSRFFDHVRDTQRVSEPVSIQLQLSLPRNRPRTVELITVPIRSNPPRRSGLFPRSSLTSPGATRPSKSWVLPTRITAPSLILSRESSGKPTLPP